MKEYDFEYTKQEMGYAFFLISFAIMIGCSSMLSKLISSHILFDLIFSVALGVAFFLIIKQRIKRSGNARLTDSEVILELTDTKTLPFNSLKYYYVYNGKNGIVFTLGLLDGAKFKMSANKNFCNIEQLESFLKDFESAIESYNTQRQTKIVHLTSILARRNAVYILLVLTIVIITGYIFTKMPLMIISIALTLPVMLNWIQYFRLKAANKLVDF